MTHGPGVSSSTYTELIKDSKSDDPKTRADANAALYSVDPVTGTRKLMGLDDWKQGQILGKAVEAEIIKPLESAIPTTTSQAEQTKITDDIILSAQAKLPFISQSTLKNIAVEKTKDIIEVKKEEETQTSLAKTYTPISLSDSKQYTPSGGLISPVVTSTQKLMTTYAPTGIVDSEKYSPKGGLIKPGTIPQIKK